MKRPLQDKADRSAPDVVVRKFFHQGPYTTSWPDVPKCLRDELESRDISPSQIDSEFLAIMSLRKEGQGRVQRHALDLKSPWPLFRNLRLLDDVQGNDKTEIEKNLRISGGSAFSAMSSHTQRDSKP